MSSEASELLKAIVFAGLAAGIMALLLWYFNVTRETAMLLFLGLLGVVLLVIALAHNPESSVGEVWRRRRAKGLGG